MDLGHKQGKFNTRIRPYQPIEEARARAWNNGLEWRSVPGEPTAALAWRARGYGGVEQGRAQAAGGGARWRSRSKGERGQYSSDEEARRHGGTMVARRLGHGVGHGEMWGKGYGRCD